MLPQSKWASRLEHFAGYRTGSWKPPEYFPKAEPSRKPHQTVAQCGSIKTLVIRRVCQYAQLPMSRELEVVVEFWIGYFLVVLLYACVCGAFTSRVAREKGYSGSWYWAGFWFGLVALIAACGLPDRQEEGRQTEATRKTLRAEILAQREQENERYRAGYS